MAIDKHKFDKRLSALVPINSLSAQNQKEIIQQGQVVEFSKGSYVFTQGDTDNFSYYLLKGELEMSANGVSINRQQGDSDQSLYALAQLRPRQMSARALTRVVLFRADKSLVDRLLTLEQSGDFGAEDEVEEIEEEGEADWMTTMLQSELFSRIPAMNIQKIFTLMEEVEYGAGDTVIRQGDPGDFYYVIRKGRCQVTVRPNPGAADIKVAELKVGDSFGEEALVSDSRRNASIAMVTAGTLMRLTKDDFIELVKKPILHEIPFTRAAEFLGQKGRWIDVRMADEVSKYSIDGSLHIPLRHLRLDMHKLDTGIPYVTYCDTGSRSSVAAFVLAEYGFEARCLKGGLDASQLTKQAGSEGDKTDGDEISVAQAAAPESESAPPVVAKQVDSVDAQVQASSLQAEVERAGIQLEALKKQKNEAAARQQAQETASRQRLEAEKKKLLAMAQQADHALEEARRLKGEAEKASQMAQRKAEQERSELERRIQSMQAQSRGQLEEERKRMEEQLASSQEEASKAARSRQEMEERLRQQQMRMEQEAGQAQDAMRAAMEQRLRKEREELEVSGKAIKQQLKEAEEAKQQAAAERRAIEARARAELTLERKKHAEETARANQGLEEIQRLKHELEAARSEAQGLAARQQQEEERRLRELRQETERMLQEKESALKEEYARQARELDQLRAMKEEAEVRLQEEKRRMQAESDKAQKKLRKALNDKQKVEQQRQAIGQAASAKEQEMARREQEMREHVETSLKQERQKLEAQFARKAAELERANRERDAADAARKAAEQESKRIVDEYRQEMDARQQARVIVKPRPPAQAGSAGSQDNAPALQDQLLADIQSVEQELESMSKGQVRPPARGNRGKGPQKGPEFDIGLLSTETDKKPQQQAPALNDGEEKVMDRATIKKLMEQRRALQSKRIQKKADQARGELDDD